MPASSTSSLQKKLVDNLPGNISVRSLNQSLMESLETVKKVIPPVWPLADYVAVNPCLGLTDRDFLDAVSLLKHVRGCELLMPRSYYRKLRDDGQLSSGQIEAAFKCCQEELPEWYESFEYSEVQEWLAAPASAITPDYPRFRTVAEIVDQQQSSSWTILITNDLTRHCATHYDLGQASWSSPWKQCSLYAAWREASMISSRMEMLGLRGYRQIVSNLPESPAEAIKELLIALRVPISHWKLFLLCQASSIAGWASYVRYQVRNSDIAGEHNDDLIGLIAMRLAYDGALAKLQDNPESLSLWPADTQEVSGWASHPTPSAEMLAQYVLQTAIEQSYRSNLIRKLAESPVSIKKIARKSMQMVFCIDVRSEVFRRNLESTDGSIETLGFAGFFGLPLSYVQFGNAHATSQCPVLIEPAFEIHEKLIDTTHPKDEAYAYAHRIRIRSRKLWKSFQTSAITCFSYVESLGLPFLAKLLTDSFHWTHPTGSGLKASRATNSQPHSVPDLHATLNKSFDSAQQVDYAERILRNLGLTENFASFVVFCGHSSEVTNNPYRSALDCGACGGHSGKPNARVAAALLNDKSNRAALASRGIDIPEDTCFIAAVHCTTTDRIDICDRQNIPDSHLDLLNLIEGWFAEAGNLTRAERCPKLGAVNNIDLLRRSYDWGEVRPEWGLAGNAAFIIASRSRTEHLNLDGRTFMHSYQHEQDRDLKVLEMIMTAPMVVTNWINMQYYASAVDPKAFGSGNKVIHNVVGQFGVLLGNGGDLMTGLPWQSVHDGTSLQHEPLRLLVVIDAPRTSIQHIIEKHAIVDHLVSHGWVTLLSWEGDQFYRWTAGKTWRHEEM